MGLQTSKDQFRNNRGWLQNGFENIVLYDKTGVGDGTKTTSALMQHNCNCYKPDSGRNSFESDWKLSIQHV